MMNPKKKHKNFFDKAREVSFLADHRCKIGAVITHKNKIISAAYNQKFIWDELTKKFNPNATIHAEVAAILKIKNKRILRDCEIFIYRERAIGGLGICKPCGTCTRILKSFGLIKIHFTSPEGYHHEEL